MAKPMLKVALPLSYAARKGDHIHVQLQLDGPPQLPGDSPCLRLHHAKLAASSPAARLEVSAESGITSADVATGRLADGCWVVEVSTGPGGPFSPVPAFLVISHPNPVALLLGQPEGDSAPPASPDLAPPTRSRLAHRARVVVDRAVAGLPPMMAGRIRAPLRMIARRFGR